MPPAKVTYISVETDKGEDFLFDGNQFHAAKNLWKKTIQSPDHLGKDLLIVMTALLTRELDISFPEARALAEVTDPRLR